MNLLNILGAKKQIAELTNQLSEWSNKYSDLEKQLTEAQDTIGNFMQEKETFNTQLETIKADYEAKLKDLEVKMELTKASVVSETTKKLANIGITEGEVKDNVKEVTPEQIFEKWNSLKKTNPKEADAFYGNNRSVLMSFVGFNKSE